MNTLHIKYAIEVERTGSISRAAENLFMGQPNLSKAIRELEDTVGFKIFKRTSRGVMPTHKGELFLQHAHLIVSQLDEISNLNTGSDKLSGRFTLTVPDSNYIASAVSSFLSEIKQDTDITVKKANAIEGIRNVAEDITNLALIRFESVYDSYFNELLKSKGMRSEVIWSFDAVLLASHLSELSRDIPITREMLKKYTEITYGDVYSPQMRTEVAPIAHAQNKNSIKLDDREVSLSLLSQMRYAYMITAPVPQKTLDRYGIIERKCEFVKKYTDMLIYLDDYSFSALDHDFMNSLYAAKNEVAYRKIK